MCHSTPTPASGANVIPFPTRCAQPDSDPRYAHLGRLAYDHFKARPSREDKLAEIRAIFAESTPAPHPGESEILELLRRIDRRLESQLKGA